MTRIRPANSGDERSQLNEWLDFHRATVRLKCVGLSEADAHRSPVPTSPLMSPAGLVGHLRWVEFYWFEQRMAGRPDTSSPWTTSDHPDAEMLVDDVPLSVLLDDYDAQCEVSRKIAAEAPLDGYEADPAEKPVSLRWVMLHMVEETARHNGHLDIVRELLDGVTGE